MDSFYKFVEERFKEFKLVNITKKINSRNIANHANIINDNPSNIYLIEKRPLNVNIFRNMNYPNHRYMFLNREKVFVLEDTNIEPHIDRFSEFLNTTASDKKSKKRKNKKKKTKNTISDENLDSESVDKIESPDN